MDDIDLSILPEISEMIAEMEWRTILRCLNEGHQWIERSHNQMQCKACSYYLSEVDDNGVPRKKG